MLQLPFNELYQLSISHPELVWNELAQQAVWNKPYKTVIDDKQSLTRNWFVGGEINMSYNCLDRAIDEGYGNDVAVIYESPVTNTTEKITYKQLLQSVELFAGVMVDKCGVTKGDRVLLYFPVIPQCLIAMLACTRIGAVYSLVFGGFPPRPIASRITRTEPKLIITCNVGFKSRQIINYKENIDLAIEMTEFTPDYCIVYNRPKYDRANMIEKRDLDWTDEMRYARHQGPIPVESNHPMSIIYTSGTTGEPKGLIMGTGNSVVFDKIQMKYFFNVNPRECFWMFSDFVWISGQTLLSYSCLLGRCTSIIYEGEYDSPADSLIITKMMKTHKVVSIGSAPSFFRMLRNNLCHSNVSLSFPELRSTYIGGEKLELSTREWLLKYFNCEVFNIWGQTEMNSVVTTPFSAFDREDCYNCIPIFGIKLKVVNIQTGEECPLETVGRILVKVPSIPGFALSFYKDHDKFIQTYFTKFPGYFDTMDAGRLMSDGSLEIHSRIDDIIQVAAIRISGSAVQEFCLKNNNLLNAAVIPLDDAIYGQVPFGFLVKTNNTTSTDEEIISETIDLVRDKIGEYAQFRQAVIVPDLPLTRSFKISKFSLEAMVNGRVYTTPSTVSNLQVYQTIYDILSKKGYKASLPIDL